MGSLLKKEQVLAELRRRLKSGEIPPGSRQMFRDLAARTQINALDNGMVDGNVSLADKQAFGKLEQDPKNEGNKEL